MTTEADTFSYRLYPSIGVSTSIEKLYNFWFDVVFKPKFQIRGLEKTLITTNWQINLESVEWFGDFISFKIKILPHPIEYIIRILCQNESLIIEFNLGIRNSIILYKDNIQSKNGIIQEIGNLLIIDFKSNDKNPSDYSEIMRKFEQWVKISSDWITESPRTNRYVDQKLWDYHWVLQRINSHNIDNTWAPALFWNNRVNYGLKYNIFAHLLTTEDIMWFKPQLARSHLLNFFHLWRESDGMIANSQSFLNDKTILDFDISQPPVWAFHILDYFKLTGDSEIIPYVYEKCKKNITWWEKNRFNQDYQLFYSNLSVDLLGRELGMPNSPRFTQQYDGKNWHSVSNTQVRKIIPIDLNAQMADYYQVMGVLGMISEDPDSSLYFQKAEALQDHVPEILWDPVSKFYYDYDIETKIIQPLKTVAGFWSLFGGIIRKSQLNDIIKHLTNPEEFWTELPVPLIAINERLNSKELWQGPVSIAQDFWLIIGLHRFNANNIVAKLVDKVFRYLNGSFALYHTLYDYYPAMSFNIRNLSIKGSVGISQNYHYDNLPLHSLFFRGLLGGEILDDSLNFIPDWSVLDKEVNFNFYYRGKRIDAYLDRSKKYLEFNSS